MRIYCFKINVHFNGESSNGLELQAMETQIALTALGYWDLCMSDFILLYRPEETQQSPLSQKTFLVKVLSLLFFHLCVLTKDPNKTKVTTLLPQLQKPSDQSFQENFNLNGIRLDKKICSFPRISASFPWVLFSSAAQVSAH